MKNFLAFDLGASSGRAIIGRYENGKVSLEEIHRFANGPLERQGGLYWDINALFAEIKNGLKKAVALCPVIDGIGIDTWGVDYCFIDKDGKLLDLPHHYRDPRTDAAMPWMLQRIPKADIYAETGIQFMNLNTIFQLAASVKDNDPLLEQADKLLLMPNALTYMLCGAVGAEYSIATTTQLYNPTTKDWSWKIIDAMGLKRSLFPAIKPSATQAGVLSEELQKEVGCGPVPVFFIGGHDTASAVASVPATDGANDWAYLSSGTWSLLGVELDQPVINDESLAANYTNEGGIGGKIRFLKNIMGLWIIQECRNQWIKDGNKLSFAELTEMAANATPFLAVINPNDHLFEAPGDMPSRIRDFCRQSGQRVPVTPGETIRVALESLALRYRQTWTELESLLNKKLRTLHLIGGGCQNKLLNQFTANAIQAKVVTGPVEATAVGNILCQAIAAKAVPSLAEARKIVANSFDNETFLPTDAEKWEKAYETYCGICAKFSAKSIE